MSTKNISASDYPTYLAKYGLGGYQTVQNIVERNSKNKELADNLARNLNDEAQENKTNVPITYQVVEIVN